MRDKILNLLRQLGMSEKWADYITVEKEEDIAPRLATLQKLVKSGNDSLKVDDFEEMYKGNGELRRMVDKIVSKSIETYKENHPALTEEEKNALKDFREKKPEVKTDGLTAEAKAIFDAQNEKIDKLMGLLESDKKEKEVGKRKEFINSLIQKYEIPKVIGDRYKEPEDADEAKIEADLKELSDTLVKDGILKLKEPGDGGGGLKISETHANIAESRNSGSSSGEAGMVPGKEI